MNLTCFKAYDIRGKLGEELNENIVYRIARAYAVFLKPVSVVVGGDVRLTSSDLKAAFVNGLRDEGVNVIDIGLCGTEEIYFATSYLNVDGGCVVTASHNPIDYNGLKFVKAKSHPISSDTGLNEIKRLAEENNFAAVDSESRGSYRQESTLDAYIQHLLTYIDIKKLRRLKLVVNAGNGAAGHVINALEKYLPFEFIKINHEPNGHFPNGIPNPLLKENQPVTSAAVLANNADMGIAWDGDFDRCFLFDEQGQFTEGYYIVGLLAESFLLKNPGAKIIHDPRLTWNTQDIVSENNGLAIQSKTGHAFIKERMRLEDAVYGGEMSAHHYFRDFFYCDSGMIPWLLVAELICSKNMPLSEMLEDRINKFPSPGEINRSVIDAKTCIESVYNRYSPDALVIDTTDGISLEFDEWRFNLRMSNTEPVVRLNVESRGDKKLIEEKTKEILALLQ